MQTDFVCFADSGLSSPSSSSSSSSSALFQATRKKLEETTQKENENAAPRVELTQVKEEMVEAHQQQEQ
jgi:hypothetical protein